MTNDIMTDAADKTGAFQALLEALWSKLAKKQPIISLAIHDARHGVALAQAGANTLADTEIGVAVGALFGPHGAFGAVFDRFEEAGHPRDEMTRVTYKPRLGPYHVSKPVAEGSPYILTIVYRGEPVLGAQIACEEAICRDLQTLARSVKSSPGIHLP